MKDERMTKPDWRVATFLAILVPLAGGTLGCFAWVRHLTGDNLSWIVMCSLPFVAISLLGTAIIATVVKFSEMRRMRCIDLLAAWNSPSFIMAAWFLDGVSGV